MDQEWLNQYGWMLAILLIWELIWKGWALWRSARLGDKAWFIALLILNTAGILPIFYIIIFSKRTNHSTKDEA